MMKPSLSIVLPFFNEEENLEELFSELSCVCQELEETVEYIFVDDGSSDKGWDVLKSISSQSAFVKGVQLSRNFGHQIALVAGIEHANGEVVITMDADLQHPPALIPCLIEKSKEGYDIVNTIRSKNSEGYGMKKLTSSLFYRIVNEVSEVHIQSASPDFRLMNRKAVSAFLRLEEKDRFNRGLIGWMGFNQAFIEFDSPERKKGKTKYTYRKMIEFAGNGIFSFSSKPLRWSFFLGVFTSILGLIYAGFSIIQYFLGNTVAGWTSIMVVVLMLGGIQLISLGIIGEYLNRVFNEVKNRPMYFVQDYLNRDDHSDS